ncbi:DUF3087 domain-containing protein [Vibrio chagasii]|nr:DUF3087 domain-containing protein [Vibrio chagasii]
MFAIVFGTILISTIRFRATSIAGESTGNFHLNELGVILSVALNAFIANRVKGHDYFKEALYVWNLKQQIHNQIYRKLKRIQPKAEQGDRDAYHPLLLLHHAKQVYDSDNNTLTIKTVQQSPDKILELSERWSIEPNIEAFRKIQSQKF